MHTAFIGLGSNLGDRLGNLGVALERIAHLPGTHLEAVSHAYESEPAYHEDQPRFLNAVAKVRTGLSADTLLEHLLAIEDAMGRVRDAAKGPRAIDLDLLLFDDEEWASEMLTLPHPGLRERDFVVTPLLEIEPDLVLPDGSPLDRSQVRVGRVVGDAGPVPDVALGHDVPHGTAAWVPVAQSETVADRISGFDASLELKRQTLTAEGIPVAWDPYEPGADIDPFGMPTVFRLMVPAEHAERARELLAALDAANVTAGAADTAGADARDG